MIKKLSAKAIQNATTKPDGKPNKLTDGGGLYLLTNKTGKYWRYDYRYGGKRKTLALGVYPDIGLSDARKLHELAREQLAKGVDPSQEKRREKLKTIANSENTFRAVADQWFLETSPDWSESYAKSVDRIMRKNIYPYLGNRPIKEIEPPEILQVLRRMEKTHGDSTRRAQQLCGQVFRYGVHNGKCPRDQTQDLRGAIKRKPTKHYPAITDPVKLGELLRAIEHYGGDYIVKQALKFQSMMMTRPQQVRFVEWDEIDFESALWHVPARKKKLKQSLKELDRAEDAEVIPLPQQAIAILNDVKPLTGHLGYVFYSNRSKSGVMSDNTLNNALKRLGFGDIHSAHGFRSTARTLLEEQGYRFEVLEKALFHHQKSATVRAYARSQHLEARAEMLQAWADYLDGLRQGAQVIPIKRSV